MTTVLQTAVQQCFVTKILQSPVTLQSVSGHIMYTIGHSYFPKSLDNSKFTQYELLHGDCRMFATGLEMHQIVEVINANFHSNLIGFSS